MLLAELGTALLAAIEQDPRHYCKTYAATFRWASDDSKAEQDAQHFQDLIQNLGLEPAEEYIMMGNGLPSHVVATPRTKLLDMIHKAARTTNAQKRNRNNRVLVIVHYAGHAKIDHNDMLLLHEHPTSPNTIEAMGAFWDLALNEPDPGSLDNVDFIFIFDSWFGGPASRAPPGKSRIVEILAAANGAESHSNSLSNPRTRGETFTSKLAQEVKSRKGRTPTIGFGELISGLTTNPSLLGARHHILLGPKSIRIPLPAPQGQTLSFPAEPSHPRPYSVIFSITMDEELGGENKIQEVARLIESFSIGAKITVFTVHGSECSTGFIIEAPYWVYLNLAGRDGVRLVFSGTRGSDILRSRELWDPVLRN